MIVCYMYFFKPVFVSYKCILSPRFIFVNKKLTINDKKFTKNAKYLILMKNIKKGIDNFLCHKYTVFDKKSCQKDIFHCQKWNGFDLKETENGKLDINEKKVTPDMLWHALLSWRQLRQFSFLTHLFWQRFFRNLLLRAVHFYF